MKLHVYFGYLYLPSLWKLCSS